MNNPEQSWLAEESVPMDKLPSYAARQLRVSPERGFLSIVCGPDLKISLLALHNGAHVSLHARNDLSVITGVGDLSTQLKMIHAPQEIQEDWSTNSFMIFGDRESVAELCKVVVETVTRKLSASFVTVSGRFAELQRQVSDR
jgi:hypothetical protein